MSQAWEQAPELDESSVLYRELYYCCYLKGNRLEKQEPRESQAQEGQPQLDTLLGSLQEHQHLLPSQPGIWSGVTHSTQGERVGFGRGEDTPQHPVYPPSPISGSSLPTSLVRP